MFKRRRYFLLNYLGQVGELGPEGWKRDANQRMINTLKGNKVYSPDPSNVVPKFRVFGPDLLILHVLLLDAIRAPGRSGAAPAPGETAPSGGGYAATGASAPLLLSEHFRVGGGEERQEGRARHVLRRLGRGHECGVGVLRDHAFRNGARRGRRRRELSPSRYRGNCARGGAWSRGGDARDLLGAGGAGGGGRIWLGMEVQRLLRRRHLKLRRLGG